MIRSLVLSVLALSLALPLLGCESDPGKVSQDDLKRAREATSKISPGMTKEEVMKTAKYGAQHRLSAATVDGVQIEEYKLEAYHDDDWNKTRDLNVAFLYFVDDVLVDLSDKRLSYRDDAALISRWTGKTVTDSEMPSAEDAAGDADGDAADDAMQELPEQE